MSYNRQYADSLHSSSSGGRYQGSAGGRDWEQSQRERPNSRPPYARTGMGVAQNKERSSSVERSYRGSPLPAQSGSRLSSDQRYRGSVSELERARGWDRARREREYSGSGTTASRYSSRHGGSADGEPQASHPQPPSFVSRHSIAAPAHGRARSPPPFSRRATEPSEVLEEGELEVDERNYSRSGGMGSRTFTMPSSRSVQPSKHGEVGSSSAIRGSRPSSSLSLNSQQSTHSTKSRQADRKPSQSYSQQKLPPHRQDFKQDSRSATPSPKHGSPTQNSAESIRTPSPEPLPVDTCSTADRGLQSFNEKKPKFKPSTASAGVSADGDSSNRVSAKKAAHMDEPRSSQSRVPKQELHSRISDIDREIAECQEKLVMISGTPLFADSASSSGGVKGTVATSDKQKSSASNDRAVPTSPTSPLKGKAVLVIDTTAKPAEPAKDAHPCADTDVSMQCTASTDLLAPVVPQSRIAGSKRAELENATNAIVGESANWLLGDSSTSNTVNRQAIDSDKDSDSESEEEGMPESHPQKDKLKMLIGTIYRENQMKAAEMQAKLAEPFLAAYPTFVPGSYPSPTDWPFWDENVKIHEKVKPHLTKMLAREKIQYKNHARRLQEEYSALYSKWRKRVDKLDRQREAKYKNVASGTTNSAGASNGGSSNTNSVNSGLQASASFTSMSNRRRHASGPPNPAIDEFGFSLGPLFSASASTSFAAETGGRAEDFFLSDAVHSEAELQAIIEKLQHDDARNPDIRSQRTAAVIPNMVIDPKEREVLRFNNSSHLVTDPISFYHVQVPDPGTSEHRRVAYANNADSEHYWTQSEVSAFVAAYLTHPKQFGKIASYIPHKSMNDCVLFYYRNKKPLRLKELEAKSNKRARRSRQTVSIGGGSGGRKRKERARERRERKAREERERMALEAAAGCAPGEYFADPTSVGGAVDDGQMTNARTSTFPSDDESSNAANGANSTMEFTPEAVDILERRSKSSALLRSIIAADRQRKSQAAMEGAGLLGLGNGVASDDSMMPLLSPTNDGCDEDEEVDDESPTSASAPVVASKRSRGQQWPLSPGKSRRKSSENQQNGPLGIPISAIDSASRQADDEGDNGSVNIYAQATRSAVDDGGDVDDDGEIEEGEERSEPPTAGTAERMNTSDSNGDEEEGELVEDNHWEPRRPSQLYLELTAYALGGSIVRTRRAREIERANLGRDADGYRSGSGESDEDPGDYSGRKNRKTSLTEVSYDEEDEIVEASGVIGDSGAAANSSGKASVNRNSTGSKSQQMQPRPRIVSRRSQSRFGATLTAVLDPDDGVLAPIPASVAAEQGSDDNNDGPLYLLHQQNSRQRSPSIAADKQRAIDTDHSSNSPPKESALDRYVTDETLGLKRPISSYETLLMCSPAKAGVILSTSPVRGVLLASETSSSGNNSLLQQQRISSSSPSSSSKASLVSGGPAMSSKKQFEIRIEEEAGSQHSVLVGAAVWLRDDRKRVLRGLHKLGPDFAQVASLMPSKTTAQCRYFYYHYRTPAGVLISEIIPSSLSVATTTTTNVGDSRHGSAQPGIGTLVLPQLGKQSALASPTPSRLILPSGSKQGRPKGRPATTRLDSPAAQGSSRSSTAGLSSVVKRQRTKSPASPANSSSDDEDDETPLAAQLAEELAAQAVVEGNGDTETPLIGSQAPIGLGTLALQQRRASEIIAQVRPELLNPRVTPIASLVLPPKPNSSAAVGDASTGSGNSGQSLISGNTPPSSAVAGTQLPLGVGGGDASIHKFGRMPSPHASLAHAGGAAMTAKKSGYSSYWSVHERSAFMHYIVRLGQDWHALAEAIGSKTGTQVRNFFRANREKLGLDAVVAEYEKNKAAGTLPPMTPFQPLSATNGSLYPGNSPASTAPSSAAAGLADEPIVKKEKRGRKRKNEIRGPAFAAEQEMQPDSIPLSQIKHGATASQGISPISSTPNTAPANMTSFPTMGIDGGRAVVYTRPGGVVAPAAQHFLHRPQSSFVQPRIAAQHTVLVREGSVDVTSDRIGMLGRAESDTLSSQATPPPVEGLPRLSSSPAPEYGPSGIVGPIQQNIGETSEIQETREIRVTKINALLNDDSPTSSQAAVATDWFDAPTQESDNSQQDAGTYRTTEPASNSVYKSSEEEATGIAALALAAMMGASRSPPPNAPPQHHQLRPQQQPQARHSLSVMQPPRQQSFVEQQHYHVHHRSPMPHRPSDPYSSKSVASGSGRSSVVGLVEHHQQQQQNGGGSMPLSSSAFSPVTVARGSPLTMSPPPMLHHHYHHMQTRPSSVGPSTTYHQHNIHSSPRTSLSREMSPPRVAPPLAQVGGSSSRQRKPSAPPLPPPPGASSSYTMGNSRASMSSYTPYNMQQQQQPVTGHRLSYSHTSPSLQQVAPVPVYSENGSYVPPPPPTTTATATSAAVHRHHHHQQPQQPYYYSPVPHQAHQLPLGQGGQGMPISSLPQQQQQQQQQHTYPHHHQHPPAPPPPPSYR